MARRGYGVSGARARSFPVFHIEIRLYAIGQTDVYIYVGHEKVMEITTMWGSLRLAPIRSRRKIDECEG